MHIVNEETCQQVFSSADALTAVESVFASMASNDARNFPVIREALGYQQALYGFKSGFDQKGSSLGLKSGGYWPNNVNQGLTNHQSTVFLFDPDSGRLDAVVGGNYLTAIRTAAASAVSIKHLARQDSKVLGMIGAGHQSSFQLKAALEQHAFEKVVAWNIEPGPLDKLEEIAGKQGIVFQAVDRESLCAEADVIITITSAHEALLQANWLKPGTHIACMGTDTIGKQEVDPVIFKLASIFTDEVAQAILLGESQHAFAAGFLEETRITAIGDVINNVHPGRQSDDEITLFDGTGVGLQDLAAAKACVKAAVESNSAIEVTL